MTNKSKKTIKIGDRNIGPEYPTFVIAEISANHNGSFERAKKLVKKACECGADAVKLQTYTPDTLTLESGKKWFQIEDSNPDWNGKTLYELYEEAYTPWEWHEELKEVAKKNDTIFFSTAYDDSAVDFLEELGIPAYKVASFEATDVELLKKIAGTGKPVIISRGMSSLQEISESVSVLKSNGIEKIALLHCVSSYPAKPEEMNLATISNIQETLDVIPGLSDHSLTTTTAIVGVTLGACVVEKHLTLDRDDGGPDASFSLEPDEFKELIEGIRVAEKSVGKVAYELGEGESDNVSFRRSLWVTKPVKKGEEFTKENIGRYRPAHGLPVKHLSKFIGKKANQDIDPPRPLSWDLIG
ncbi:MAG: pseudaminic acid synthase [Candidatus Magasanikbacteria bacterium]